MFITLGPYQFKPSYLEKLRSYFKTILPNMLRNYQQKHPNEKGCWVTTILPSLLDRQIRMSSGNLTLGSNIIETNFVPASRIINNTFKHFLENFEIKDSLPLVVINSVSAADEYHMIIIGGEDNDVYAFDSL